jgi:hypothetical protein
MQRLTGFKTGSHGQRPAHPVYMSPLGAINLSLNPSAIYRDFRKAAKPGKQLKVLGRKPRKTPAATTY